MKIIDLRHLTTEDMQYDLAMLYADENYSCSLALNFAMELKRRHAPIPSHCRWSRTAVTGMLQIHYDLD